MNKSTAREQELKRQLLAIKRARIQADTRRMLSDANRINAQLTRGKAR